MGVVRFFMMGAKLLVEVFPTWNLHHLIDWEVICGKIQGQYRREQNHWAGRRHARTTHVHIAADP